MQQETPEDEKVLCSRCGKVANPTDSWEHGWPLYGEIILGFPSTIDWRLTRHLKGLDTHDRMKADIMNGVHPVVVNDTNAQRAHFTWDARIDARYRLCLGCQAELIEMIGRFFFSNMPAEQPIHTRQWHEKRIEELQQKVEQMKKELPPDRRF